MSTWVVGDVQGCLEPLDRLLERIGIDATTDRIWFCGDLVNRGGQSLEVLRRVRELGDRAQTVLGNHDLHLLAEYEGLGMGGAENPEFVRIFEAHDGPDLLEWLRFRPMTLFDRQRGFLLVHAGLLPQWDIEITEACARELEATLRGPDYRKFFTEMYGNQPDTWRDDLSDNSRLRVITNAMTRLRFCDPLGAMNLADKGPPGSQTEGYLPWFDGSIRCDLGVTVLFGHWSALGLYYGDGVIGLDTGCVWGGPLTAINLDHPDQPIQVPGL